MLYVYNIPTPFWYVCSRIMCGDFSFSYQEPAALRTQCRRCSTGR